MTSWSFELVVVSGMLPVLLVHVLAALACAARWPKAPARHAAIAALALFGIVHRLGWFVIAPILFTLVLQHTPAAMGHLLAPLLTSGIDGLLSLATLVAVVAVALLTEEPQR